MTTFTHHAVRTFRLTCALALAAAFAAPAVADDDLWLAIDFDGSVEPTAAVPADISVTYTREGTAWSPDGKAFEADRPRYVDGVNGQGLYIGRGTTNLLSKAMADIAFDDGMVKGLQPVGGAKLGQVTTDDAWSGDTALQVSLGGNAGSGVKIPLNVPGGMHDGTTSPKLFVFSAHVNTDADLEISIRVDGRDDDNWFSTPVTVKAGDSWQRPVAWLFADVAAAAEVSIVSKSGSKADVLIDGLQLEAKERGHGSGEPGKFPYGRDHDADAWSPGDTSSNTGRLLVRWKDAEFPNAEGTMSVWVKPLFNRGDADTHPVVSRSHVFYQLTFQNFNQLSFYRRNEVEEPGKNKWGDVRVARPENFAKGEWALLTATWSNRSKLTRLYYNGELLGEKESQHLTDNGKTNYLFIGSWSNRWALNGVVDELRVYSRAMSADEIAAAYKADKPR